MWERVNMHIVIRRLFGYLKSLGATRALSQVYGGIHDEPRGIPRPV